MPSDTILVAVENLVKTYGPLRAVNDLSFKIKAGEIVGLLGPNGAGKSTTMKMLTCYLAPTSGTASIAGINVNDDALEVRKHIGYLPEHAPLYMDMRVSDYLDFAGRVRGLNSARRKDRIDWAVGACGLQSKFMAIIGTLSRGFRQRVGLADARGLAEAVHLGDSCLDARQLVDQGALLPVEFLEGIGLSGAEVSRFAAGSRNGG